MKIPKAESVLWLLADNLLAAAFAFGFFVLTARVLPPIDFGVSAMVLGIGQILTPMIESLFHDALIQREALTSMHRRTAATVTCLVGVAASGALVAVGWLYAGTGTSSIAMYLPWLGVGLMASAIMAVPAAEARRERNFRLLAGRTIAARTIATAVGVWLVMNGYGVWAIVVQFVLATVLATFFLLLTAKPDLRPAFDRSALRDLSGVAIPAVGTQVLVFANSRVITLLFGWMMGPLAAGTWSVALRFVEPVQTLAATTIGQFALPIYARAADPSARLGLFVAGSGRAAMLLIPMFVGLAICADPLIRLFVGEQWQQAAPIMSLAALAMAATLSRQLMEIVFTASGLARLNLIIQAQASLLSIVGVALGGLFGLIWAAIGWTLRVVPFFWSGALLLRRRLELSIGAQLMPLVVPAIASGAMTLAVLAAWRLSTVRHAALLELVIAVAVGAPVYSLVVLIFAPELRRDLRRYLTR